MKEIKIWQIKEEKPVPLISRKLDLENRIEEWLEKDISLLAEDLAVIGTQVKTEGGFIDILAINGQGSLVIVELKRDKTCREVVAQALDYASSLVDFDDEKLNEILQETYLNDNLTIEKFFEEKFGYGLDEVEEDSFHEILIVASEIDSSTSRIVEYLNEVFGVPINGVIFNYFKDEEGKEFLARSFLKSEEEIEKNKSKRPQKGKRKFDYSEYKFNGEIFNKRRLVKKVVETYVEKNPQIRYEELKEKFPNRLLNGQPLLVKKEEINEKQHSRYFPLENLGIAVSNQWTIDTIKLFIEAVNNFEEDFPKIEKVS